MATHVVLDLETLSTRRCARIVSIGAQRIINVGGEYIAPGHLIPGEGKDQFYEVLYSRDQTTRVVDQATLTWWDTVPEKARAEYDRSTDVSLSMPSKDALEAFAEWFMQTPDAYVWGKGPSFDNAILSDMYQEYSMKTPWRMRHEGCLRTAWRLCPDVPEEKPKFPHHAMYDAIAEAQTLIRINNGIKASGLSLLNV